LIERKSQSVMNKGSPIDRNDVPTDGVVFLIELKTYRVMKGCPPIDRVKLSNVFDWLR
jgi:hypothetical protein